MSISAAAPVVNERRPMPGRGVKGASPAQLLRLAVLFLIAAASVSVAASPRSSHAASPAVLDAAAKR